MIMDKKRTYFPIVSVIVCDVCFSFNKYSVTDIRRELILYLFKCCFHLEVSYCIQQFYCLVNNIKMIDKDKLAQLF